MSSRVCSSETFEDSLNSRLPNFFLYDCQRSTVACPSTGIGRTMRATCDGDRADDVDCWRGAMRPCWCYRRRVALERHQHGLGPPPRSSSGRLAQPATAAYILVRPVLTDINQPQVEHHKNNKISKVVLLVSNGRKNSLSSNRRNPQQSIGEQDLIQVLRVNSKAWTALPLAVKSL